MIIYVDLDGTLLDVSRRHYLIAVTVAAIACDTALPLTQAEYWAERRSGRSDHEIINRLGGSIEQQRYAEMKSRCVELPALLSEDRLFDCTVPALERLRALGALVLVSHRTNHEHSMAQIRAHNLDQYFASVHLAPDNIISKAALAAEALRHSQAEPRVFIGDSEADLEAARALGIGLMLVESGVRNRDFLAAACGDSALVFRDIAQCADALESATRSTKDGCC